MRGFSRLAEKLLASQEGLCSLEVVFMCDIYVQVIYTFIYKYCLNIKVVGVYVERYSSNITFGLIFCLKIINISRYWI